MIKTLNAMSLINLFKKEIHLHPSIKQNKKMNLRSSKYPND